MHSLGQDTDPIAVAFNFFAEGGVIQVSQLGDVLSRMGKHPSSQEVQEIAKLVDKNSDGKIELSEFQLFIASQMEEATVLQELPIAFNMFDQDNSGEINAQELKRSLAEVGVKIKESELHALMVGPTIEYVQFLKDLNRDLF